jgi:membrane associated rhomboid family serine protease
MKPKHKDLTYFVRTLSIIIGLVLIWRGIWHVVDYLDIAVFDNNKLWTAIGGIILGILLLYIPDRDLKEIEKL